MNRPPNNTQDEVKDFVQGAPKVELHSHLGGSVDPELAYDFLKNPAGVMTYNGDRFHSAQELDAYLRRPVSTLEDYLHKHHATRAAFNSIDNIGPIVDRMVQRYSEENTHILEIRTALKSLDKGSGAKEANPDYTADQEMKAYIDAINAARTKYNMVINLILCIRRGNEAPHEQMARWTLEAAKDGRKDGVVGLDLVGKENGHEARPFAPVFQKAKEAGLKTTVHAGESVHEGSIKQAIKHCLVDRVGHGTSLIRHSDVYEAVRASRIPLEICLTSNIQCQALSHMDGKEEPITDLEHHPFPQYYSDGLVTTINVDNLVVSNTSLTEELMLLHSQFGLPISDIAKIIRNGAVASFSTDEEKKKFHQALDSWTDQFRGV